MGSPVGPHITARPFQLQFRRGAGLRSLGKIQVDVVGEQDVEAAIAVAVQERAPIPQRVPRDGESRARRRILELAAQIAIQDVGALIGHPQVGSPVVVVVAGADSLTPAGAGETGFPRRFLELSQPRFLYRKEDGLRVHRASRRSR